MDGWNMISVIFRRPMFKGYVGFRECICFWCWWDLLFFLWEKKHLGSMVNGCLDMCFFFSAVTYLDFFCWFFNDRIHLHQPSKKWIFGLSTPTSEGECYNNIFLRRITYSAKKKTWNLMIVRCKLLSKMGPLKFSKACEVLTSFCYDGLSPGNPPT